MACSLPLMVIDNLWVTWLWLFVIASLPLMGIDNREVRTFNRPV